MRTNYQLRATEGSLKFLCKSTGHQMLPPCTMASLLQAGSCMPRFFPPSNSSLVGSPARVAIFDLTIWPTPSPASLACSCNYLCGCMPMYLSLPRQEATLGLAYWQ